MARSFEGLAKRAGTALIIIAGAVAAFPILCVVGFFLYFMWTVSARPAIQPLYTSAFHGPQVYPLHGTLDAASVTSPHGMALDLTHRHLLAVDGQQVKVFDIDTGKTAGVIETYGQVGSDNAHFRGPEGIAFDEVHGRILVTDGGNSRIQLFDGTTFAHLASISVTKDIGPNGPLLIVFHKRLNRIIVLGEKQFQTFDGTTLAPISTFTVSDQSPDRYVSSSSGVALDEKNNRLIVSDNYSCVRILDADTFSEIHKIGVSGQPGNDNAHFYVPAGVAIDPAKGYILVADALNSRIQVFNSTTFAYVGIIDSAIYLPDSLAVGMGHVFVTTSGKGQYKGKILIFGVS